LYLDQVILRSSVLWSLLLCVFSDLLAFIETPYRNNKLFEDFTTFLNPSTSLCVAADLTLESEFIKTHSIAAWKKMKFDLHKRPAIFILQA
jgi:16S rRNA (cytidine1402-2'-O)-methyltransferase